MGRDALELSDAYATLEIVPPVQDIVETDGGINIFLWKIHQESLTVAKAISLVLGSTSEKVNIILVDIRNWWSYVFDGKNLLPCKTPKIYHYVQISDIGNAVFSWDAPWFQEYAKHKFLISTILRMQGIRVPQEVVFRKRHNETGSSREKYSQITELFGLNKQIVLKPSTGQCGNGVQMLSREDIGWDFYDTSIHWKETMLLQEKIESFPIIIDEVRKDWNLRVLVTFDPETETHLAIGMIGRIDDNGKAVNISKTAEYITFREISQLAQWSKEQAEQVEHDVFDIAVRSVTSIVERVSGNTNDHDFLANHQTIAGVDVIVTPNLEPVIIEVNSANSGWMYQLMKCEWIDAIIPIANSILIKSLVAKQYLENSILE